MSKFCLTSIVLLVGIFLAANSHAQEVGRFKADIIIGGTAAQIHGDDLFGFNKPGLELGLGVRYDIRHNMDLSVELLYSQQGSRSAFIQNSTDPNITFALNYAYIPVLFYLKDWTIENDNNPYHKIMAVGGFAYGRLIDSKIKSDFVVSPGNELIDAYRESSIYYILGAQINFTEKFGVAVRYNQSLSKVFDYKTNPNIGFESFVPLHLSLHLKYNL